MRLVSAILLLCGLAAGQSIAFPGPGIGTSAAACSSTIATDLFTGTNNTTLPSHDATWLAMTSDASLVLDGSGNAKLGAATPSRNHWNATFSNDQCSKVTLSAVTANQFIGATVRVSGTSQATYNVYYCLVDSTRIFLGKLTNNADANLGTFTGTISANDVIEARAHGTTIECLQNGTVRATATDSTHTSGKAGVYASAAGGTPRITDWTGSNY